MQTIDPTDFELGRFIHHIHHLDQWSKDHASLIPCLLSTVVLGCDVFDSSGSFLQTTDWLDFTWNFAVAFKAYLHWTDKVWSHPTESVHFYWHPYCHPYWQSLSISAKPWSDLFKTEVVYPSLA